MKVQGFHACKREFAIALQHGEIRLQEWKPSKNAYDWLGGGIYFWEGSRRRAEEWGHQFVTGPTAIIEAEIELGVCFDLSETKYLHLIQEVYDSLVVLYRDEGWSLPKNRSLEPRTKWKRSILAALDWANGMLYPNLTNIPFARSQQVELRFLDCLVMDQVFDLMQNGFEGGTIEFETVRCPFEEGEPLFPGSMIRSQNHVQIAVRNSAAIQGFSVIFP